MSQNILNELSPDSLKSYLEFLMWHYKVIDALWFLKTEENIGRSVAENLNTKVWEKAGALAAKDLVKRFNITEKGITGFVKAQKLYPWAIIIGYDFEQTEDELFINVKSCPSQEARKKHGLPEYACKEMHKSEFEAFAHIIDPDICVRCVFAPPDKRESGFYCRWHFYMKSK